MWWAHEDSNLGPRDYETVVEWYKTHPNPLKPSIYAISLYLPVSRIWGNVSQWWPIIAPRGQRGEIVPFPGKISDTPAHSAADKKSPVGYGMGNIGYEEESLYYY
jgi:hypothetical protein